MGDRSPDIFLAIVTSATPVGNTRPAAHSPETVSKIHEVCFYSLRSSRWDNAPLGSELVEQSDAIENAMTHNDYYSPANPPNALEHPCLPLTKILSSGSFYYAVEPPWDLSSRLSVRLLRNKDAVHDVGTFDERFVWNEYIVRSLLDFRERLDHQEREDLDRCQFIVRVAFDEFESGDLTCLPGTCYTRLCRCTHHVSSCAADQRKPDCRHPLADFTTWLETGWNSFQHPRRRR